MGVDSLLPDVITCNAAISSCEKGCQWEMSLNLFHAMSSHVLTPSIISYNAAISSCEKGSCWELGLHLFSQIIDNHLTPTVISFNATLSGLGKSQEWQRALHVFTQLVSNDAPNVISYTTLISALNRKRWQLAARVFSQTLVMRPSWTSMVVWCCRMLQGDAFPPQTNISREFSPPFFLHLPGEGC